MKSLNRSLAVLTFGLGLSIGIATPVLAQPYGFQYGDRFGDIRGLVDRTQTDLRQSAELERNGGDQRDRYRNAQRRLSTFDRHLTKGHFDKGALDSSIDTIKAILDKNTLQASARDALYRDMQDLRAARDHRY